jgi:hypothetical protein
MTRRDVVHLVRVVASFGLLGGVCAGALFGWLDNSDAIRAVGFVLGAGFAAIFKVRQIYFR